MPQDILDKPIPEGKKRKIRYFFSTPIEFILIIADLLLVLLGIGVCWFMAYQNIGQNWLLIINPPIFILIFGLAPVSIISLCRTTSLVYEEKQDVAIFEKEEGCGLGAVSPMTSFVFNAIFLVSLLGDAELIENYFPSLWVIFFGIVGPLQTVYIFFIKRRIKILKKELED